MILKRKFPTIRRSDLILAGVFLLMFLGGLIWGVPSVSGADEGPGDTIPATSTPLSTPTDVPTVENGPTSTPTPNGQGEATPTPTDVGGGQSTSTPTPIGQGGATLTPTGQGQATATATPLATTNPNVTATPTEVGGGQATATPTAIGGGSSTSTPTSVVQPTATSMATPNGSPSPTATALPGNLLAVKITVDADWTKLSAGENFTITLKLGDEQLVEHFNSAKREVLLTRAVAQLVVDVSQSTLPQNWQQESLSCVIDSQVVAVPYIITNGKVAVCTVKNTYTSPAGQTMRLYLPAVQR